MDTVSIIRLTAGVLAVIVLCAIVYRRSKNV